MTDCKLLFSSVPGTLLLTGWFGVLLLANPPAHGDEAQPGTPSTRPPIKTAEQIIAEWGPRTPEELLAAANAGNSEAAYAYGLREMDQGRQAVRAASRYLLAAEPTGPVFKREDVFAKWKVVPREELLKAVTNQNREAQYYWGKIASEEATQIERQGFTWLEKAAGMGLAQAQFDTGMFYARRKGIVVVERDFTVAVKWLERAGNQGLEPAAHQSADFQLEGLLGQPDLVKAVEVLQHCVDLGCNRAEYQLAMLYANGNGEPRHAGEAPAELLKKAINGKIPLAQIELAERYRTGFGVAKNMVRSARFYVRASLHENLDEAFQNRLQAAFSLLTPKGKPKPTKDPERAQFAEALVVQLRCLRDGEPAAMMEMAQLELAAASDKDARLFAYYWLSLAQRKGAAAAGEARSRLEKQMSVAELDQARADVAEAVRLENESRK